jgi:hypothetical protein
MLDADPLADSLSSGQVFSNKWICNEFFIYNFLNFRSTDWAQLLLGYSGIATAAGAWPTPPQYIGVVLIFPITRHYQPRRSYL